MKQIFELEMWSRPNTCLPSGLGKDLKQTLDSILELDESIFLGLNFVPDKTDSENLLLALNNRELDLGDFHAFCKAWQLAPSTGNYESAARFLEFQYGRPLAWLHLPHDQRGLVALNKLLAWAVENGYTIQSPDLCYCLLPAANVVPPEW